MSSQITVKNEGLTEKFDLTLTIRKVSEADHIVAGYCSVEEIDKQNDLITLDALEKAWNRFWENKEFAVNMVMHSNIPVGRVIEEYETEDGQVHKSGVDDTGLYIVSKIRDDIKKGRQTWKMIQEDVLRGFSIGGEVLSHTEKREGGKRFRQIDEMELHEISIVDNPANKSSLFTVLKRDSDGVPSKIVLAEDFASYDNDFVKLSMRGNVNKKEWDTAYINNLPDSAFIVIEPAYKQGKTENKNARHLPYKNKSGEVDKPHLRNALARMNQIKPITDSISTSKLRAKAKKKLKGLADKHLESSEFSDEEKYLIGKPFGPYKNFAECVRDVKEKNPDYTDEQARGTCAKIHHQATGKYPSQKNVSYDLVLLRSNSDPVHRDLGDVAQGGSVSQKHGGSESAHASEENADSRTKKIIIKGDLKWVKKLRLS